MHTASSLTIQSRTGTYEVNIGAGEFQTLMSDASSAFFLADERFEPALAAHNERTVLMQAEEGRKTLSEVERVICQLRDRGTNRGDNLIVVGGGIVQDVATGVAQQFMRGIEWSYVPTTLLAMCDSCIGGKSSLNVGGYKNLAGSFYPPRLVVIDTDFLATLPANNRASGLCEAMKISFCHGPTAFSTFLDLFADYTSNETKIETLIHHTLVTKAWFIEIDEYDRDERRRLNFGHTFGHALESATDFSLQHGIAIGIGIICAERLGVRHINVSHAQPELVKHAVALVREAPGVARNLAALDRNRFEHAFLSDKKHSSNDSINVILPSPNGGVIEQTFYRDRSTITAINAALDEALSLIMP